MLVFGGRRTGSSHILKGIPCQDAFCCDRTETGEIIVAVADGLGSAGSSEIGSEIAVNSAVGKIKSLFRADNDYKTPKAAIMKNRDIINEAFYAARKALEEYAADYDIHTGELACTLIVAFTFEGALTTGQIGDGAITGMIKGNIHLLSDPGDSEYINEVTPLTSGKIEKNIRINENLLNVDVFAVFTDGCQRAFLEKKDGEYIPFEPFFRPFFSCVRKFSSENEASDEIMAFLGSEKMENNSDDDKTLVIAVLDHRDANQ